MATTIHCEPWYWAASRTSSGLATAALLMETLSAPALSRRWMSATLRTPPPTVSGMKIWLATDSMMGRMRSRSSLLAVMSRNVSSSAPWSLYLRAISTGSPASMRSTKLMPLTTRPAVTSRHGIMRQARSERTESVIGVDLVGQILGFGEVERALIEAATQNGAFDAFLLDFAQRADVVEVGDAARGDDRNADMACQGNRGFDIDAREHAVAANVGIDDGFAAVVFELASQVEHAVACELAPAIGSDFAVAGIEA